MLVQGIMSLPVEEVDAVEEGPEIAEPFSGQDLDTSPHYYRGYRRYGGYGYYPYGYGGYGRRHHYYYHHLPYYGGYRRYGGYGFYG